MAESAEDTMLAQDEIDVPMEELEEKIEDELLSADKEEDNHDEANQETEKDDGDGENKVSEEDEEKKEEERKKEEEEKKKREEEERKEREEEERKKREEEERKKREAEEDAASDAEIEAEDERRNLPSVEDKKWPWHIELYPIATEDMLLDNFSKLCSTASYSQVVFREPSPDLKKGEAHFYAEDLQTAKTIIRTACCKRFTYQRPYLYIYKRKPEKNEEYETAVLRLDLLEVAKVRWDRQKRAKGEPATRIAKVSNVPAGTSKEFLSAVFARAYRVKMEMVMTAADTKQAKAAKTAREKAKAKRKAEAKAAAAAARENDDTNEEEEADEDSESESEDEEEENFGRFSGSLTVDCSTRASLKGFLLGYRKVAVGESLLDIKPLSDEEINVDDLRKEARKRRWDETVNGPTWIPVPPKIRFVREEWGPAELWEDGNKGSAGRGGRGGSERGGGFRGRGADRGGGDRGGRGRGGADRSEWRGGRGGRTDDRSWRRGSGGDGEGYRGRDRGSYSRDGDGYGRGRGGYGRDDRDYGRRGGYGREDDGYGRHGGGFSRGRDRGGYDEYNRLHDLEELDRQIATLQAMRDYEVGQGSGRYGSYYDEYGGRYEGGYREDDYWRRPPVSGGRGRRDDGMGYGGRRH